MEDIDFPELAAKVIVSAKITKSSQHEQELALEFTDGTSFSFCCTSNLSSDTSLYRGGVGQPEIVRALAVE